MKKLLLFSLFLLLIHYSNAQVFWTEDFNAGSGAQGSLANTYTSGNGAWVVTDLAGNSANANQWYVSDQESGAGVSNCGAAGLSNPTLHIGNVSTSPVAVFSCPTGDCGAAYDASAGAETNRRAESPLIDCSGQTGITLEFLHIGFGEIGLDYADAVYSDDGGSTWNVVPGGAGLISDCCCLLPGFCTPAIDPVPCSDPLSGQGYWQQYSLSLPASCDNNPNVKVGFLWVNDGNNGGSDPSCAIDDVTLSSTTVTNTITASFSPDVQTLCEGDCVTFTDLSSSTDPGGITDWQWTFNGGTPSSFNGPNPPCVVYNTAGTYSVELTVTDATASDDTLTIGTYITVETPADAGTNGAVTFCDTDVASDLYNELGGTPVAGGTWSPALTSGIGVFDPAVDAAGTYTYTITSSNSCADATADVVVTVNNCANLIASFTASGHTICQGDCVTFLDASSGPDAIQTWEWTFTGGTPSTFTGQNPPCIDYDTPGTYPVTLVVTDVNAVNDDTTTIASYITVQAAPDAGSNANFTICDTDGPTDILAELGGTPQTGGTWSPALASGTNMFDPAVDAAGTYTYTVTGSGVCTDAFADLVVTIDVCNQPIADFTASALTICEGECITLTDNSTGTNITSWEWDFGAGATPATFSGDTPPQVCYTQSGVATVSLTIIDDIGSNTTTVDVNVTAGPAVDIPVTGGQCEGSTVTLSSGTAGIHLWSDGSNGNTIDVTTDGTYWVEVNDGTCTASDTVDITFHEPLMLDFTVFPETCIDANDGTVQVEVLQGDEPLYYSWLSGDTVAQPNLAPGIYTVSVTNDYNCEWQDTVTIDPGTEVCPDPAIYIPNIFSPNGDGVNDLFEVYGKDISSITIQVFDRWGKQVFFTSEVGEGWDGTYKGKPLNTAVFAYMINVTFIDYGDVDYSGNVTLVRKP